MAHYLSYARALQDSVIKAGKGQDVSIKSAQDALGERAKVNSQASMGQYSAKTGASTANESLYVKDYRY
jgi:fructose-bisphosphate aldolase class 1